MNKPKSEPSTANWINSLTCRSAPSPPGSRDSRARFAAPGLDRMSPAWRWLSKQVGNGDILPPIRRDLPRSFHQSKKGFLVQNRRRPDRTKMMTAKLSVTSRSTEARKYLHDTEVRYGAPELELFRLKPPPLSKSFGLIFVVTAHRNADGARHPHRAIGRMQRSDEKDGHSRAQRYRPVQ